MLDWIFSESFLVNVIAYAIPIIFASYASLISNKAGISAINIEGAMSVAAVTGALIVLVRRGHSEYLSSIPMSEYAAFEAAEPLE